MRSFFLLVLGLVVVGCAATPVRTGQAQYRIHAFDGAEYELTFSAAVKAIRDEGFSVKIQDRASGQITAIFRAAENENRPVANIDDGRELILNFDRKRRDAVWIRVSLQDLEPITLGVQNGKEVLDPEAYNRLYQRIESELAARKK